MVIPAGHCTVRVIFRRVKHRARNKQYVVQHTVFVIVRTDNRHFVRSVYMVIVSVFAGYKIMRYILALRQLSREHGSDFGFVLKIDLKKIL